MEDTGERHILNDNFNDKSGYYIHLMHVATYEFAFNYVKNKKVLDYGCGSGYGTYMYSNIAENVVGTDISTEAIDYAKNNFYAQNLLFKTIPELTDEKFDVITSFQVIEHVQNDEEYIKNLKRLLKPNGSILISTPDRTNRLFSYIQKPWNVFHVKEYNDKDLHKLLRKHFDEVEILKIGSNYDFVMNEISRTKKQKLFTLPCTLSIYPDFLKIFLLKFQKKCYLAINKIRNKQNPSVKSYSKADFVTKYTTKDIKIARNLDLSTDLLAICTMK